MLYMTLKRQNNCEKKIMKKYAILIELIFIDCFQFNFVFEPKIAMFSINTHKI